VAGRPAVLLCALAVALSRYGGGAVAAADPRPELSFTRVNARGYSVWIANADGSRPREIAGRAAGGRLSSDGRWLSYYRLRQPVNGHVLLYLTDLATGSVRRIGLVSGEEWSPTGAKLAIVDGGGVVVVDPASGRRRRIVRSPHVGRISFSPDGRAIAYDRHNARGGEPFRSDIFVVRLSDAAITRLTHDGQSASPLWGPEWMVFERLVWRGGLRHARRLWLMRPDGSGRRFLARGAEGLRDRFPVFGLAAVALSKDGRRLLACQSFEFGCPRVTFTVQGGRRYGFPKLSLLERKRHASPVDLSRDGARVLLDVGNPHDNRNHDIYALPFAGGALRLVVRDAIDASWRH
jgi:hypothetical protein